MPSVHGDGSGIAASQTTQQPHSSHSSTAIPSKLNGGVSNVVSQASKLGVMPQIHGEGCVIAVGELRISSPQWIAPKKLIMATAYELNAWLINSCEKRSGKKNTADNTTNGIKPAYPNTLAHAGGLFVSDSFWLMVFQMICREHQSI
jgi:hypothetical protein